MKRFLSIILPTLALVLALASLAPVNYPGGAGGGSGSVTVTNQLWGTNATTGAITNKNATTVAKSVHVYDGSMRIGSGAYLSVSNIAANKIVATDTGNSLVGVAMGTGLIYDSNNQLLRGFWGTNAPTGAITNVNANSGKGWNLYPDGSMILDGNTFKFDMANAQLSMGGNSGWANAFTFDGTSGQVVAGSYFGAGGGLTFNGIQYTWPASQSADLFLKTDGSGNLSWAPASSAFQAITNGQSVAWVDSNKVSFVETIAANTISYFIEATNATQAANNSQAYSPFIHLSGNGYNGAVASPVEWQIGGKPTQASTKPGGYLEITSQTNSANGFGGNVTIDQNGTITNKGNLVVGTAARLNIIGGNGTSSALIKTDAGGGVGITLDTSESSGPGIQLAQNGTTELQVSANVVKPKSGGGTQLGQPSSPWKQLAMVRTASLNEAVGVAFGNPVDAALISPASGEIVVTNANGAAGAYAFMHMKTTSYSTNLSTMAPSFAFKAATITTNAAFTFLAPISVSASRYETVHFFVTNSTAVEIAVTLPANVHPIGGPLNITNLTEFEFSHYGNSWTNCRVTPVF